jgi:DNA-binding transcriptional regulator YiaG
MKKKSASSARGAAARWSPAFVKRIRKTHNLSQTALALMTGVGLNTVYLWEKGLTKPRAAARARVEQLAKADTREVAARLRKVGLTEGMKKPGRKPKSASAKAAGRKAPKAAARKKSARRRK